mmetsp:Transcript_23108/g.50918  ORF Transcript_23108/g.50918 Transcript_23108/m.50918 type:complete len:213 (+) Transcript_23108:430-1068(+)
MSSLRAVATIMLPCSNRSIWSRSATRPATHLSANLAEAPASTSMDSNIASLITGKNTFSSNWPLAPAMLMVTSLPITRAAAMVMASAITGFTFPGMMLLPGATGGMIISASPALGPLPSSRISLAILNKDAAIALSCPWASTTPSCAAWASKWLGASINGMPVQSASCLMVAPGKFWGVLIPVPTAVPPRASSVSASRARWARSIPFFTWAA